MEEVAILVTVLLISSILGCGTCIGMMNYYRRRRGEPIHCCFLEDRHEVSYSRLDEEETNKI
jgi:hypothetical protein